MTSYEEESETVFPTELRYRLVKWWWWEVEYSRSSSALVVDRPLSITTNIEDECSMDRSVK
ncbi:hypothetical protein MTR_2g084205 [Medicago truncatula]|uniref:Uncharacterized protein n=1 Tax=Medicago truncatula TaxID=3880 RepID=A0A072VAT8_MEDTR|nr:hypothetical protein MTR_2g084205 [Medicago truncatula]